jgi:hypothetical protein
MSMREAPGLVIGMLIGLVACSDERSATELNPEGPPMVRQVFVQEKLFSEGGVARERFGLAFGDHPDIPLPSESSSDGDDRVVEAAVAFGGSVRMRIVFDELLRGNDLEEIECNDNDGDDEVRSVYSRVPVGTDPDDIERCSGSDLSECTAVCIGPDGPLGIKDANGDGAVDNDGGYGIRMIDYGGGEYGDGPLGVSVVCDDMPMQLVGTGPGRTFYSPSGNQLIPAGQGLDGLGPALILRPAAGLRTGSSCTVQFRPEVVDKDGERVCAPPGGDVARGCAGDGDTSEIQFRVEPLAFRSTTPRQGAVLNLATPTIQLEFVAPIDPDTLGAITMSAGGTDVPIEIEQVRADDATAFRVTVPGGLQPETAYTIDVGTGLADAYGGTPPAPFSLEFTTSEGADQPPPVDAGPDQPDAG